MLQSADEKRQELNNNSNQRHKNQLNKLAELINSTPADKGSIDVTLNAERPQWIKDALWHQGYYVVFKYPDQWHIAWNVRCNSPEQQLLDEEYRKRIHYEMYCLPPGY